MSNYAAVRDKVMRSTSLGDNLPVGVAYHLFELSWEAAKGDESQVGDLYVARLKAYLAVPSTIAPVAAPPPPAPVPGIPMLRLDLAAVAVILDALGPRTLFDEAARAQVRRELVAEMRRLDVSISVRTTT
jgi:hypothetical protein